MCGVARKAGDVSVLFPKGAVTYDDIPWFLFEAINQGFLILSWHENYTDKELPPQHLWEDSEGLELWFDRVHQDRGWTSEGEDVPDASDMEGNELARMFKD